ncbi:MAG: uroporphyrinogen decarboxylase family protein [Candidatus Aminicenantales bacterium]|jgi:uroporphyrinogen decarboxylase
MTSRELLKDIIALKPGPRCGLWLGNPHPDSWPGLHRYFGTRTEEDFRHKLGDDYRWISPSFIESTFHDPSCRRLFDLGKSKTSHGQAGPLAGIEDPAGLDAFDWPDPRALDFKDAIEVLKNAGPYYRASGFWSPFFHDIMDLFGMEDYFVKMRTNPAVVQAVTDRVCGFYHEANERFFEAAGNLVDGFFFGNDFGTQRDLMISPALFDEFVLPWFKRFTEQALGRGYQVILHSCGSIHRVIPRLIEAGVDCLHPLQAKAANMDAATLSRDFKGKIAFLGGLDTQGVLNQGSPGEVKAEVRRIKDVLGPCLIVSPSHEAILPDVPPRNVAAMAEAALE